MNITVSTHDHEWTDFEQREWAIADQEHYSQPIDWNKKEFNITAFDGKKTVGNLRLNVRVGVAYIDALIVTAEYRHKGVGKSLVEKAEEVAKEQQAHKIYLETGKDWDAVAFYQKQGYCITSHLPKHYYKVNFVVMTKFI